MKCPLLTSDFTAGKTEVSYTSKDCLKEECAWWDNISCCCQMTYLKDIASALVFKKEVDQ